MTTPTKAVWMPRPWRMAIQAALNNELPAKGGDMATQDDSQDRLLLSDSSDNAPIVIGEGDANFEPAPDTYIMRGSRSAAYLRRMNLSKYVAGNKGQYMNVHGEPIMTVIDAVNQLAVFVRDPGDDYDAASLIDLSNDLVDAMLTALSEYETRLAAGAGQVEGEGEMIGDYNTIVSALKSLVPYVEEISETIGLVIDAASDSRFETEVPELFRQLYAAVYHASNYIQRAGDRFDQFVINLDSPDEIILNTDYDIPVFALPEIPTNVDVTQILVAQATDAIQAAHGEKKIRTVPYKRPGYSPDGILYGDQMKYEGRARGSDQFDGINPVNNRRPGYTNEPDDNYPLDPEYDVTDTHYDDEDDYLWPNDAPMPHPVDYQEDYNSNENNLQPYPNQNTANSGDYVFDDQDYPTLDEQANNLNQYANGSGNTASRSSVSDYHHEHYFEGVPLTPGNDPYNQFDEYEAGITPNANYQDYQGAYVSDSDLMADDDPENVANYNGDIDEIGVEPVPGSFLDTGADGWEDWKEYQMQLNDGYRADYPTLMEKAKAAKIEAAIASAEHTATKHNLSLKQLFAAMKKAYDKVMAGNGGWILASPLVSGLSSVELKALYEEGFINYDGSRFTLTRRGYEAPQMYSYPSPPKPGVSRPMPRF